jgi:hypothetical protein
MGIAKKGTKGNTASIAIVEATAPSTALAIIPQETATVETPEAAPERIALSILRIKGARKEGKQTIIHSNLWGKERWFAKSRLHSYTNHGDGSYTIIIPTRELEYRDNVLTEPLASIAPYTGEGEPLAHQGGSFATLSQGY